jgi:hypothetical protein
MFRCLCCKNRETPLCLNCLFTRLQEDIGGLPIRHKDLPCLRWTTWLQDDRSLRGIDRGLSQRTRPLVDVGEPGPFEQDYLHTFVVVMLARCAVTHTLSLEW